MNIDLLETSSSVYSLIDKKPLFDPPFLTTSFLPKLLYWCNAVVQKELVIHTRSTWYTMSFLVLRRRYSLSKG